MRVATYTKACLRCVDAPAWGVNFPFNPKMGSISLSRDVGWENSGGARYEDAPWGMLGLTSGSADVFDFTILADKSGGELLGEKGLVTRLYNLTIPAKPKPSVPPDKLAAPRPPLVRFGWGSADNPGDGAFNFVGVIDQLKVDWALFDATGAPIRAEIQVTLKGRMNMAGLRQGSPALNQLLKPIGWDPKKPDFWSAETCFLDGAVPSMDALKLSMLQKIAEALGLALDAAELALDVTGEVLGTVIGAANLAGGMADFFSDLGYSPAPYSPQTEKPADPESKAQLEERSDWQAPVASDAQAAERAAAEALADAGTDRERQQAQNAFDEASREVKAENEANAERDAAKDAAEREARYNDLANPVDNEVQRVDLEGGSRNTYKGTAASTANEGGTRKTYKATSSIPEGGGGGSGSESGAAGGESGAAGGESGAAGGEAGADDEEEK